jgi:acetyl esterase/lipase
LIGERIVIWEEEEYAYPAAYGFIPFIVSYIHEDDKIRPAMVVAPGGAYRYASPYEGNLPALEFYRAGYNVFVLVYTVNHLDELEAPLGRQPLRDISRAVRIIRARAAQWNIDPLKVAVCGFSAGGHLCASLCVHFEDIEDPNPEYEEISNRPDAAVLCYPVITAGKYANRESFRALLGTDPDEKDLEYMSLEKHVTEDTPPCFLWQTATDASVPVENSYLFAEACRKAGVSYAHHVFSDGIHGMSVATEEWLDKESEELYTLEQIRMLAEAVMTGKTSLAPAEGEEMIREFALDGRKRERWTPEVKEWLRGLLGEAGLWTELAERWLAGELDLK